MATVRKFPAVRVSRLNHANSSAAGRLTPFRY